MRTGKVILKKGHMNRHPKGVRTLAMWLCGLVGGGGGGESILAEGPACAKTLRQERPMWLKCAEHAWLGNRKW